MGRKSRTSFIGREINPSNRATRSAPDIATGQRVALSAAAIGGFLTPFMGSAVNIALPAIGEEFRLNAVSLGWVTSAFLLAAAVFLLPFGRLADIVGRKRVFIAGLTVFAVATLPCAVAPSGEALIALRIVQGLGGALIFGTGTAILTSVYPSDRLGRALGINVAAVYPGLSLGPFLGGVLTAWNGATAFLPHHGRGEHHAAALPEERAHCLRPLRHSLHGRGLRLAQARGRALSPCHLIADHGGFSLAGDATALASRRPDLRKDPLKIFRKLVLHVLHLTIANALRNRVPYGDEDLGGARRIHTEPMDEFCFNR